MAVPGEDAQKTVNVWVARSKSLRIVIFGKTGTGKSSLINTLFDEHVADEGDTIYAETKIINSYTKTITIIVNDVRVTIWDTPGLKDPYSDGEKTIKEIGNQCGDIDLFVYCMHFTQRRLGQDDIDCIRDITKAFGDGIWKRALFALTFANEATVPPSNKTQNLQEYFQSREKEWRKGLHKAIRENTNPWEIADGKINSIPVVATGYRDIPLPDGRNWFAEFWRACLSQVKFFTIPALIRVTGDRANGEAERDITARVVGQRLAEIGDHIAQVLESEMHTDNSQEHETLPRVTATAQWFDILIEAIQNDQSLGTLAGQLVSRGIGHTLAQHKTSLFLVASVAVILFITYQVYRSSKK